MRRLAASLAVAAMALQALWPLIAQARPATLVPICTVGGVTHYVEIPGGTAPADPQHCQLCFVGAALPAAHVIHASDAAPFSAPNAVRFSPRIFFVVTADARAPPVLPLVLIDNANNGRKDEEALALRAARAHVGGSVVRFGILLG